MSTWLLALAVYILGGYIEASFCAATSARAARVGDPERGERGPILSFLCSLIWPALIPWNIATRRRVMNMEIGRAQAPELQALIRARLQARAEAAGPMPEWLDPFAALPHGPPLHCAFCDKEEPRSSCGGGNLGWFTMQVSHWRENSESWLPPRAHSLEGDAQPFSAVEACCQEHLVHVLRTLAEQIDPSDKEAADSRDIE